MKGTGRFQKKTLVQIEQLKTKLRSKKGYVYTSLGHFYREIELVKFPYTERMNYKNGRNVYSQQQYDTILKFLVREDIVTVFPNPNRNNYYQVVVN